MPGTRRVYHRSFVRVHVLHICIRPSTAECSHLITTSRCGRAASEARACSYAARAYLAHAAEAEHCNVNYFEPLIRHGFRSARSNVNRVNKVTAFIATSKQNEQADNFENNISYSPTLLTFPLFWQRGRYSGQS